MRVVRASKSAVISAPTRAVYSLIADYRQGHPRMLPPRYFPRLKVERGGVGAGTNDRTELKKTQMPPVFLQVMVKPNARTSSFAQEADGTWVARLKSPPVDGKANDELIALVAAHFRCRKTAVTIKSGASGRRKRIKVDRP